MESRAIAIALKGMDTRWGAANESAIRVRDMWWDPRGAWSSSGGYRRIIRGPEVEGAPGTYTNPFAASGQIESVHFFSQHTGARSWLIYIDGSGNLYQFNPSTAARSASPGDAATDRDNNTLTRAVVATPWQRSQSACWGDHFYLVNGIDRPLVFNGYWWDYAGFSGPAGAPSATAMAHPHASEDTAGGTGGLIYKMPSTGLGPTSDDEATDYICAYRYRVAYVNSRGQESPLSEPSGLVTFTNLGGTTAVGAARHFAHVAIPVGGAEVVARRVYRTQNINDSGGNPVVGRGEVFYFHSEIQDNITVSYMDALPDGFLGSAVDDLQLGPWPGGARFLAPFKGCMFATGTGNSAVYYSAPNAPEVFPLDNILDVGDANLGPITAMYATRNALVVFKANAIYLIKGDSDNGFHAETLTREAGCIAPNTVREVPDVGLVFLSADSVCVLQGTLQNEGVATKVINLGTPIPTWMRKLNRSALMNACAAVYHRDKEFWLCVPTLGYRNNNLVLVYHYEIGEWSYRENLPVSSILETPDHRGHLIFGSYASTTANSPDGVAHLGIHVYGRGWPDKDGTAIEPLYETGEFSGAGVFRTIRPKHVIVQGILHGNNDLTLNLTANRSQASWLTAAKSQDQQLPHELVPVYGSATFDTAGAVWQQWRPGPMRFDVENTRVGPVTECSVTLAPESGTRFITISGMSMEVAADDPTNIKPLRPTGAGGR